MAPISSNLVRHHQEQTAEALDISVERETDLGNGVLLKSAFIPHGEFMMGSPEDEEGRLSDETHHRVLVVSTWVFIR